MKFNFSMFTGKNKWLWIVAGIVLFALFYFALRSGGAEASTGSGAIVVSNPQPSDAAIAANAQLALGQMQLQAKGYETQAQLAAITAEANRDIALAQIGYDASLAEISAGADISKFIAANEAAVQSQMLTSQLDAIRVQSEYGLASAEVTAQTQIRMRETDAAVLMTQLATNASMFNNSLAANVRQAEIQQQTMREQALATVAISAPKGGGLQRLQALGNAFNQPAGSQVPITKQKSGGLGGIAGSIGGIIAGPAGVVASDLIF